MSQALAGQGGRVPGRSLLTLANVITAAVPFAAGWNDSHIFNERWPAHARFHGVTALGMSATLSAANILSLWSGGSGEEARARFFAAAVPVAYWAPFFLAPLVPGTAVDDPPHPVQRVLACRSACWAQQPPPLRRRLAGSSTAVPPASEPDDPGRTVGGMTGRFPVRGQLYDRATVRLAVAGRTVRGVSRVAAIADHGVVFIGELDHDVVSHDAAATGAAHASRPGYVRLSSGVPFADVDMVVS